ncbi:MAG: catalase [Polyangiales bacterium]|nr:catalase [Sandaracinus sp.]
MSPPKLTTFVLSAVFVAVAAHVYADPPTLLRNDNGAPVGDVRHSQTAGPGGPVLLQDWNLIQRLARFDRERIPERVVHARGTGAFGTFVSAGNFSNLTKADFLGARNRRTPVAVRFSTVIHPSGSPETLRDPRGFAVKLYTREGNYDVVGNNLPVFFLRDAIQFPDLVHSFKPNPRTNRQEPERQFAFLATNPHATNMFTWLWSDLGTPATYREMAGSSVHAFVWVNARGERRYVRYEWRPTAGERNLTAAEAAQIQGRDFQHMTTDLYENIRGGGRPSWDLYVRAIEVSRRDAFDFDPLDPTKEWTDEVAPAVRLGRMTLERMPENYFEEIEQLAFSPGSLVPGVEPSEDRLLQGRLFSYADTQRYRLGANYLSIPVNAPRVSSRNHHQDGAFANGQIAAGDNFYTTEGALQPDAAFHASPAPVRGTVQQAELAKTNDFAHAGARYRRFTEAERRNLVSNLVGDLRNVTNPATKLRVTAYFFLADPEYGLAVARGVGVSEAQVRAEASRVQAALRGGR